MSGTAAVLGLDIGGTKLAAAVVTTDGVPHGFRSVPTEREQGPDAVIDRLLALGRDALAEVQDRAPDLRVEAVGISCGGPLDTAAGVLLAPIHLPGWVDVPITELASRGFGLPAVLQNDATAGALAEHAFGAGRGTQTMLYLTISTGIGGGTVINGRVHHGATGNGGELGHVLVVRAGRRCSCGRSGCIEAYASGTNIAARAQEALDAGADSTLRRLTAVTAADVSRAAAQGDRLAVAVWDETTDLLAEALTDLVNVFEPEVVVLGGGVTRAGAQLFDPVRELVRARAMPPAAGAARIEPAALGDAVCVVGAAATAMTAAITRPLPVDA